MEQNLIENTEDGHDPDKPGHLTSDKSRLSQCQPRHVRCSDEEVDGDSVEHVEIEPQCSKRAAGGTLSGVESTFRGC